MRDGLLGLLVTLAAAGGCSSASNVIPCGQSIAQACAASGNCTLTWDDQNTSFCALPSVATPARADCGRYHAITIAHPDANTTYYYEAASGALVAIVLSTGTNGTTTCTAGPTDGFAIPLCTGDPSQPLPQCLDAGTD